MKFLEVQDNFFTQFQILFKGKRKINSAYSMSFSFIVNLGCAIMFFTLLLELITHSRPTVNFSKVEEQFTTNITVNSKDLLYTIGFKDKFYNDIRDPSIATIIPIFEKTIIIGDKLIVENIPLDSMNCTNLYPYFEDLGLGKVFNSTGYRNNNCFNGTTSKNEQIIIGGKYGTPFYGDILIYLKKCINSTSSDIICKSEEEINEVIQDGWLQVHYVTSFVDLYNYSHPIQYTISDLYTKIDVRLNKFIYHYFHPLIVMSENNIFFTNQNVDKSFKSDEARFDINLAKDDGIIYTIFVCPSFTVEYYYRSYIKIQDIGASIGGLFSVMSMIVLVLITYIQIKNLHERIINSLFEFSSVISLNPKRSIFVQNKKKKEIRQTSDGLHIQPNKSNYRVDLGVINIIDIFLCICHRRAKKKIKEHDLVMREMMKYIDFQEITKFYIDIEQIKALYIERFSLKPWNYEKNVINLSEEQKSITPFLYTSTKEMGDSNNKIIFFGITDNSKLKPKPLNNKL